MTNEPAHGKTYNKTCVTSKDSDQPVHQPSTTRVLVLPSLDSLVTIEGICDQQRVSSDCLYAQADLSLHWSYSLIVSFIMCLLKYLENIHHGNLSILCTLLMMIIWCFTSLSTWVILRWWNGDNERLSCNEMPYCQELTSPFSELQTKISWSIVRSTNLLPHTPTPRMLHCVH